MSQETQEWLDQNVLVGFTEKRGNAWHYREGTNNHYVGAIPAEDVESRLFSWTAEEAPVEYANKGGKMLYATDRKVIYRGDTGHAMGVFKSGYKPHQPKPWLMDNVATIADSDLEIGSAGLLQGGAKAWVQFELPDTCQANGLEFRPFITAATSFDGSIATTYMTGAQVVVCDNTLSAALGSADGKFKIRHSAGSLNRIGDARDALGLVYAATESFQAEVDQLMNETVTDEEWAKFVEAYTSPSTDSKRSATTAANKAGELNSMWAEDSRVAPWANTAFGVLQAVNTHVHHVQSVKSMDRAERNQFRFLTGGVDKMDAATLALLAQVKTPSLVLA